jgi:hypothetical protein
MAGEDAVLVAVVATLSEAIDSLEVFAGERSISDGTVTVG